MHSSSHFWTSPYLDKISSINNKNVEHDEYFWYSSLHLFLHILDSYSSQHEILHIFRIKNGFRISNWGIHFNSSKVKKIDKYLLSVTTSDSNSQRFQVSNVENNRKYFSPGFSFRLLYEWHCIFGGILL